MVLLEMMNSSIAGGEENATTNTFGLLVPPPKLPLNTLLLTVTAAATVVRLSTASNEAKEHMAGTMMLRIWLPSSKTNLPNVVSNEHEG